MWVQKGSSGFEYFHIATTHKRKITACQPPKGRLVNPRTKDLLNVMKLDQTGLRFLLNVVQLTLNTNTYIYNHCILQWVFEGLAWNSPNLISIKPLFYCRLEHVFSVRLENLKVIFSSRGYKCSTVMHWGGCRRRAGTVFVVM